MNQGSPERKPPGMVYKELFIRVIPFIIPCQSHQQVSYPSLATGFLRGRWPAREMSNVLSTMVNHHGADPGLKRFSGIECQSRGEALD